MMMEQAWPWVASTRRLPCGILTQAAHGRRCRVDDAHDAEATTKLPNPVDDPFFDMAIPDFDLLAALFQFVLEVHHKAVVWAS